MFDTTDGSNSTENDVPDRVRILVKEHPLLRVYPNMRFGRLHVQRYAVPKGGMSGGNRKQKRRSTRKRSQKRGVPVATKERDPAGCGKTL